jgi:hypothetical protein
MNVYKLLLLLAIFLTFPGCSTLEKSQTLKRMAIAGVLGVGVAQIKNDNRSAYSMMYGSVGAASAAAYTALEDIGKSDDLKKENQELRANLDSFQKKYEPRLIQHGNSLFSSPVPKEVSNLVDPGEWKRYKMDQWVQDPNQSNIWYRQIEMFEIIPPASR